MVNSFLVILVTYHLADGSIDVHLFSMLAPVISAAVTNKVVSCFISSTQVFCGYFIPTQDQSLMARATNALSCVLTRNLWKRNETETEPSPEDFRRHGGLSWEEMVLQTAHLSYLGFIYHNQHLGLEMDWRASGAVVTRELYDPCNQPLPTVWLQFFELMFLISLQRHPHIKSVTVI